MLSIVTCQNYLDITKTIVVSLSTIILTIIAIQGLRTWKIQLKGKTEYELSRRLLRAVYKTRDAIDILRSPVSSASEISAALKEADPVINVLDQDSLAKSQIASYQRKWRYVSDGMRDLDIESFEAEVLWGGEIKDKIIAFRMQVGKLRSTIETYITNKKRSEFNEPLLDRINMIMYDANGLSYGDSDNKYSIETRQVILDIESYLRSKMKL